MQKSFWRKQHKWFGLALCFFLLVLSVSGIVLNHRAFYSKINVSRSLLPPHYKYENWNAGLLRGTVRLDSVTTLIYGYSGIWKHCDGKIADFNRGLPEYADYRVVRNVVMMPDSSLFAAGQYGIYTRAAASHAWQQVAVNQADERERFTDLAVRGDSLIVLSRDNIYLSLPPYSEFKRVPLAPADNYDGRVSLFRVVWLMHSGAMFGLPGRVALDILGLAMILLSLTGFFFWLTPKALKRRLFARHKQTLQRFTRFNFKWHKKIGVWTFFILLFVVITGWCLRPPLLIPLALNKVPGIPHTPISPDNAWADKLRAIRYDSAEGDWLLSTTDGFYSLPASLDAQPKALPHVPHVSVMGINVFEKDEQGRWLVGSLSGMWRWDRANDSITDYFTAELMPYKAGAPFGKTPVSGFSADFERPIVAEYYAGTDALPQPDELSSLPMSFWQLALELHTGRLYHLFGLAPLIWIFLVGMAAIWVLLSGWKLRR